METQSTSERRRVRPRQIKEGQGFLATFRHPLRDLSVVSRGLNTTDLREAEATCLEVETILNDPTLHDKDNPRLLGFNPKALRAFFGEDHPLANVKRERPAVMADFDVGVLVERIRAVLADAKPGETDALLIDLLRKYESARLREALTRLDAAERQLATIQPRLDVAETELRELRRAKSVHVSILTNTAFASFEKEYPRGRAKQTVSEVLASVRDFLASLPGGRSMRIRDIEPEHIRAWLDKIASERGLSPRTLHHKKNYISAFFTWAKGKYGLALNPVREVPSIAGARKTPQEIDALDLREIQTLVKALKDEPYWEAFAAFAIFAGPRHGEQLALTLDAVKLDDRYVVVRASKTGRQRRVPIERTTLLPILSAHLKRRQTEQRKKSATEAERSAFLFPSIVPGNEYKPRELTAPGKWCDGRTWWAAWMRAVERISGKNLLEYAKGSGALRATTAYEQLPRHLRYGPREWRHTFGTALGQVGMTAIEISAMMGNSPTVAANHYVRPTEPGWRWPFNWTTEERGKNA